MYDLIVKIKEMKYIFYNIGGISTRNGLVITFVVKEVIILVWLDLKLPEVLDLMLDGISIFAIVVMFKSFCGILSKFGCAIFIA